MKFAFLFPGQGAQYVGMGKDFYEAYPLFRQTFEEASDILGFSLAKIMLEGPEELLTETLNSQTAIYTLSMGMLRVVQDQFPHLVPAVCAGLSLGEYSALTAAGKAPFKTVLPVVKWRGTLMNEACEKVLGTMAVVMGLDAAVVEELVKELKLPGDLWVANFNCPGQVVLSGTAKGVERGSQSALVKGAKRVVPLLVQGAFHSGLMIEAQKGLEPYVEALELTDTATEFVMNVPGNYAPFVDIKKNLIEQVTHSVRWEMGVRAMDAKGVLLFVEMGPGKTLSSMNKRIGTAAKTISIEKVPDLDTLAAQLESIHVT